MTRKCLALAFWRQSGHLGLSGGIALMCLALVSFGLAGCAMGPGDTRAQSGGPPAVIPQVEATQASPGDKSLQPAPGVDPSAIEDRWGVQILGIRLSGADSMLDFRFRVLDPDRALPIVNPRYKPYLIDQATGAKLPAPTPPKVGPMRQPIGLGTPKANRTYSILFTNTDRSLQPGSKVAVVIGKFRASDLTVEATGGAPQSP